MLDSKQIIRRFLNAKSKNFYAICKAQAKKKKTEQKKRNETKIENRFKKIEFSQHNTIFYENLIT